MDSENKSIRLDYVRLRTGLESRRHEEVDECGLDLGLSRLEVVTTHEHVVLT